MQHIQCIKVGRPCGFSGHMTGRMSNSKLSRNIHTHTHKSFISFVLSYFIKRRCYWFLETNWYSMYVSCVGILLVHVTGRIFRTVLTVCCQIHLPIMRILSKQTNKQIKKHCVLPGSCNISQEASILQICFGRDAPQERGQEDSPLSAATGQEASKNQSKVRSGFCLMRDTTLVRFSLSHANWSVSTFKNLKHVALRSWQSRQFLVFCFFFLQWWGSIVSLSELSYSTENVPKLKYWKANHTKTNTEQSVWTRTGLLWSMKKYVAVYSGQ